MRRLISLMVVLAVLAAMMLATAAPAFAKSPWWKDGETSSIEDTETENCTWGWGTGKSGKLPCYSTS